MVTFITGQLQKVILLQLEYMTDLQLSLEGRQCDFVAIVQDTIAMSLIQAAAKESLAMEAGQRMKSRAND